MRKIYEGKARDIYEVENNYVIVATDRISMHVPLPYKVKYKGQVLNKMAEFWFNKYSDIIPNHMITTNVNSMPKFFQNEEFNNRCMLVKKLKMFPFECIVRGHITGTCWEKYSKGEDICGIKLEAGLQQSQKINFPIFTPTTKELNGTDTNVTFEEFESAVGSELASNVRKKSIEIYLNAYDYLLSKGIILADTKMEFGLDENNVLILGDELLTPDCSRFWLAKDFKIGSTQTNYDREELKKYVNSRPITKENINNIPKEILDRISKKYLDIYKLITNNNI